MCALSRAKRFSCAHADVAEIVAVVVQLRHLTKLYVGSVVIETETASFCFTEHCRGKQCTDHDDVLLAGDIVCCSSSRSEELAKFKERATELHRN
jgi:hypothetical protein